MGQLIIPFDLNIRFEPAGNRRRPRTQPMSDEKIITRRDRLDKRDRIMAARYYYWTEIKRRRFDDVLKILTDNEFFVEDRTINNTLVAQSEFYNELLRNKTKPRKLRAMFPGWDWT